MLSGIPGSGGCAPIQNVGAYGQEGSSTIARVQVFDRRSAAVRDLSNADCGFGYRVSAFNTPVINGGAHGRYVVLRVVFQLQAEAAPHVEYADLKQHFAAEARSPTLRDVRDAVRVIRGRKGMLIDPADSDSRSAGSFFKNPIVPLRYYRKLAEEFDIPQWPAGLDLIKLSAAWMVENAGFSKGFARGPVGISSKHALAIVNLGGASAKEIVTLKNEIVARVEDRFGVTLKPEPVFLGEFPSEQDSAQ